MQILRHTSRDAVTYLGCKCIHFRSLYQLAAWRVRKENTIQTNLRVVWSVAVVCAPVHALDKTQYETQHRPLASVADSATTCDHRAKLKDLFLNFFAKFLSD